MQNPVNNQIKNQPQLLIAGFLISTEDLKDEAIKFNRSNAQRSLKPGSHIGSRTGARGPFGYVGNPVMLVIRTCLIVSPPRIFVCQIMNDEWIMIEWWLNEEWWMINDEWLLMNDEWMMNEWWWIMVMNDGDVDGVDDVVLRICAFQVQFDPSCCFLNITVADKSIMNPLTCQSGMWVCLKMTLFIKSRADIPWNWSIHSDVR